MGLGELWVDRLSKRDKFITDMKYKVNRIIQNNKTNFLGEFQVNGFILTCLIILYLRVLNRFITDLT